MSLAAPTTTSWKENDADEARGEELLQTIPSLELLPESKAIGRISSSGCLLPLSSEVSSP